MGSLEIFASFINFTKPIVAAVNGPAFGGGVTQATLCDDAISAQHATYSLPFSLWQVSPEGCCSVHLVREVGRSSARKMLVEGWVPSAGVARAIALVSQVVGAQELLVAAKGLAQDLLLRIHVRSVGTVVSYPDVCQEYGFANVVESTALADSCVCPDFLKIQQNHEASVPTHARLSLNMKAIFPLS